MSPEPILRRAPAFSFRADSLEPGVTSGVATWSYVDECGDATALRIHFGSFVAANAVNLLVASAWRAGKRHGHREMSADLQRTLKGYSI